MIWPKYKLKYNSFDVYHMKHNYAQKWTVSELWAIKKKHFFEKSQFLFFFIKQFLHTFYQKNGLFATRPPFLNLW